jgi:predicted RNase H-like HicB family nuclease
MAETSRVLSVRAKWDPEAGVWVALSDDVPGLVAEATSLDELFSELQELIPVLLELNGVKDGKSAPFQLVAASSRAGMAAA